MIQRFTQHQIIRYIIGGGTSAVVNLLSLYVFNSVLHVYYITASILAFMFGFLVSLFFHKYWTFREYSGGNLHKQSVLYLGTSLVGLAINTCILFVSVEWLHTYVLTGQIVAGACTAFCTFFMSKHIVFKQQAVLVTTEVLDEFL